MSTIRGRLQYLPDAYFREQLILELERLEKAIQDGYIIVPKAGDKN